MYVISGLWEWGYVKAYWRFGLFFLYWFWVGLFFLEFFGGWLVILAFRVLWVSRNGLVGWDGGKRPIYDLRNI